MPQTGMQYQSPSPVSTHGGGFMDEWFKKFIPEYVGATPQGSALHGYESPIAPPAVQGNQTGVGTVLAAGETQNNAIQTGMPDTQGINWDGLGAALKGVAGLGQAYVGYKGLGLAEDSLKENKRQFGLNFGNQAQLTNTALEDRQRARYASNPGAYDKTSDYMDKNRVRTG